MLDFTDEQKMARQMLRQWCEKELAPNVTKMEKGELLPYELMRKLLRTFALDEMVKASFQRMEAREAKGEARKPTDDDDDGQGAAFGRDPAMSAIVGME